MHDSLNLNNVCSYFLSIFMIDYTCVFIDLYIVKYSFEVHSFIINENRKIVFLPIPVQQYLYCTCHFTLY